MKKMPNNFFIGKCHEKYTNKIFIDKILIRFLVGEEIDVDHVKVYNLLKY
jgi:hypothetical protein